MRDYKVVPVTLSPEESVQGRVRLEIKTIQVFEGYLPGIRQPAWVGTIGHLSGLDRSSLQIFDNTLDELMGERERLPNENELAKHPIAARLIAGSCAILSAGGMPLLEKPKAIAGIEAGTFRLIVPTTNCDERLARAVLSWPLALLNGIAGGQVPDRATLVTELDRLVAIVQVHAPSALNSLFLRAAHERAIPWRHLFNDVFQFGWGRRSRLLEGSSSDDTSAISITLARNKLACAKVLREAGLPVMPHLRVANLREALAAADALGYPVVVKPANLDGGEGVFAGLKNAEALTSAYPKAAELSRAIIVEKHFEGEDYRLQVYRDEVYWIAHRRPAYVVGDGNGTVENLVDRLNRERERDTVLDPTREQGYKAIVIDEEVKAWLAEQFLEPTSIPPLGKHVRLRGAANLASGGTRAPVASDCVHPDNLALAVRAARVLRLDLAGLDLLIPDIAQSWIETGAAICEVNAKPQLSHHLPPAVLSLLVRGEGRIPAIGVLGDVLASGWFTSLAKAAETSQTGLGVASTAGAWMNGRQVAASDTDVGRATISLLGDVELDALLIEWKGLARMRSGSPVDRLDALVISPGPEAIAPPPDDGELLAALAWASAFTREAWVPEEYYRWQEVLQRSGMLVRLLGDEPLRQRLEKALLRTNDVDK